MMMLLMCLMLLLLTAVKRFVGSSMTGWSQLDDLLRTAAPKYGHHSATKGHNQYGTA